MLRYVTLEVNINTMYKYAVKIYKGMNIAQVYNVMYALGLQAKYVSRISNNIPEIDWICLGGSRWSPKY